MAVSESKKQVSIAAFFSPKATKKRATESGGASDTATAAVNADATDFMTPPPVASGKRKRNTRDTTEMDSKTNAKTKAKKETTTVDVEKGADGTTASARNAAKRRGKRRSPATSATIDMTDAPPSPASTRPISASPHELTPPPKAKPVTHSKTALKDTAATKSTGKPRAKRGRQPPLISASPHATSPDQMAEGNVDDVDIVDTTEDQDTPTVKGTDTGARSLNSSAPTSKKKKAPRQMKNKATTPGTTEAKAPATESTTPSVTSSTGTVASTSNPPPSSTTPSPQKAASALEALSPVIRARVLSYQQKIDELTQQCDRLLHAYANASAQDAVLQEIYGVGLDIGLELPSSPRFQIDVTSDSSRNGTDSAMAVDSKQEHEEEAQALHTLWARIVDSVNSAIDLSSEDAATQAAVVAPVGQQEYPVDLRRFIARAVQGRNDSLSCLTQKIATTLAQANGPTNMAKCSKAPSSTTATLLSLEMEIKMLAQRTSHGARPSKANLYEDTDVNALWCWEVGNVDMYFGEDAQKTIKRMRKHRRRVGQQIRSLNRVVQLLHQSPVDEAKVSTEEAKVGRFVSLVASELLKASDRERKEQDKVLATETKKKQEIERQQAKDEEKRRRELEKEAEKEQAAKRRKSLVSYFRSIDTRHEDPPVGAAGLADGSTVATAVSLLPLPLAMAITTPATQMTENGVTKAALATRDEIVARMDATISYLASDVSADSSGSPPAPCLSLLRQRRQGSLVTAAIGRWSSRRRRDPKLGIMKLLQFHENHRPAFHGTCSGKLRAAFRRGRRPLAQLSTLDYSIDSDDEWEEEEPGESLSGAESDGDDSDGDDQLDYGDDWLAYEDEIEYVDGDAERDEEMGMLSLTGDDDEGSGMDSVEFLGVKEAGATPKKRRRLHQGGKKRGRRVAGDSKKQKLTKLEPSVKKADARELEERERAKAKEEKETRDAFAAQQLQQQPAPGKQVAEAGSGKDAVSQSVMVVKKKRKTKTVSATVSTSAPEPAPATVVATASPSAVPTVLRVSPVKAGLAQWLKAPSSSTTASSDTTTTATTAGTVAVAAAATAAALPNDAATSPSASVDCATAGAIEI